MEMKAKIIKAGLDLFSVYNASFEYFLDIFLRPLLHESENLPRPVDTKVLIDKCIDLFINH